METRQSRMDKYFEKENVAGTVSEVEGSSRPSSRLARNQELYKTVSSMDIDGFDINSNATVLDGNASDIDIDEIKEQLEEKYHVNPRNKSFGDTDEINLPKINLDETREYDINAIIAKAKSEKEIDYEEERHKKVNDVLKDIEEYTKNVDKVKENKTGVTEENEEKLKELIDTINAKELISEEEKLEVSGEMDPLDLLSDLKGDDDNTKVLGQLTSEIVGGIEPTEELTTEEIKEISELSEETPTEEVAVEEVKEEPKEEKTEELHLDAEDVVEVKEESKKEKKNKKKKEKEVEKTAELDNSFIGKTTQFNEEDFDEFDDLKEDMKITKVIIKILVFIIVLVFLAGLFILCNSKFNWGLF